MSTSSRHVLRKTIRFERFYYKIVAYNFSNYFYFSIFCSFITFINIQCILRIYIYIFSLITNPILDYNIMCKKTIASFVCLSICFSTFNTKSSELLLSHRLLNGRWIVGWKASNVSERSNANNQSKQRELMADYRNLPLGKSRGLITRGFFCYNKYCLSHLVFRLVYSAVYEPIRKYGWMYPKTVP